MTTKWEEKNIDDLILTFKFVRNDIAVFLHEPWNFISALCNITTFNNCRRLLLS